MSSTVQMGGVAYVPHICHLSGLDTGFRDHFCSWHDPIARSRPAKIQVSGHNSWLPFLNILEGALESS